MNLDLLRPEITLAATAIIAIFVDLVCSKKWLVPVVSILGLILSGVMALTLIGNDTQSIGNGLFILDNYSVFFKVLFSVTALLVVLGSTGYVKRMPKLQGEFYALILFSTLGAMLTAAAQDFISVIISIELTAIPLYALVSMLKNEKSHESAIKYILLGAVNSAIIIFGLSMIFGFFGSTNLAVVSQPIAYLGIGNFTFMLGLLFGHILVLAGFLFKTAAVPFHMWAPDVYEGAPTPITLFLSTVSKIAGFSFLVRFILLAQPAIGHASGIIIAAISALTMTIGNILALSQSNIKRLLAYSSIAQSGYMLVAVATLCIASSAALSISGLLFYMAAFILAEVAVFSVIIVVSRASECDDVAEYDGLAKRSPLLACTMTIGLLSLMGLPGLAGFIGKFFIFSHAAQNGLLWLVIIAVINSVISAYYYLRIIRRIWMKKSASTDAIGSTVVQKIVLLTSCAGVVVCGILPALLSKATEWVVNITSIFS